MIYTRVLALLFLVAPTWGGYGGQGSSGGGHHSSRPSSGGWGGWGESSSKEPERAVHRFYSFDPNRKEQPQTWTDFQESSSSGYGLSSYETQWKGVSGDDGWGKPPPPPPQDHSGWGPTTHRPSHGGWGQTTQRPSHGGWGRPENPPPRPTWTRPPPPPLSGGWGSSEATPPQQHHGGGGWGRPETTRPPQGGWGRPETTPGWGRPEPTRPPHGGGWRGGRAATPWPPSYAEDAQRRAFERPSRSASQPYSSLPSSGSYNLNF